MRPSFAVNRLASIDCQQTLDSLLMDDARLISHKGRMLWALVSSLKQWRADAEVSSVRAKGWWMLG